MNDFFALTEDDNIRLESQKPLDSPTQYGPDYYGEFMCAWLSDSERKSVKNLLLDAVSFLPDFKDNPEVNSIVCEVLRLREDEEISPDELRKNTKEKGRDVLKLMTLLFKNN